jgi:hypothetical protein
LLHSGVVEAAAMTARPSTGVVRKGAHPTRLSGEAKVAMAILLGLLAIAIYGNYQRGNELSRVCYLLGEHVASYGHPQTAQQEIDTICNSRDPMPDDQ